MGLEIERRFLPKIKEWRPEGDGIPITQGYFKLGRDMKCRIARLPWPHLSLNNERLLWLQWSDIFELAPHLDAEGCLPADWKVRVRCYFDTRYVLDIKGPRTGTTRFELAEMHLEPHTGRQLLARCGDTLMHKKRYAVPYLGHDWQVDVFEGRHAGLVTCEVELRSATSIVKIPPWVGEEITDKKLFGAS